MKLSASGQMLLFIAGVSNTRLSKPLAMAHNNSD